METGSITGQKRKLSPGSNERPPNERPSNERPSNELSIGPSKLKPVKTQLLKYGRWEKWEENGKVFYYNRPLRKSVNKTPYQYFINDYEKYKASDGNIDGIHFANKKIMSIIELDKPAIPILDKESYKKESYKKAIKYVSELLESYIFYKQENSGSNLTIRDILEFNVLATGHGGADVAMSKDINPQYVPDRIYNSGPSGILAWGSQMPISKEYARRHHYNGNKLLLKRNDKKYFRERLRNEYARIEIEFDKEMKDIESSLIKLSNRKEEILSELNDPDAKVRVLGRITPLMYCCPEWKDIYQRYVPKQNFYTKNEVFYIERLFSMAETLLNEKKTNIEMKLQHSSLGVKMSMTESFKCYDSTTLIDKRDIGQCIQTLSSVEDDHRSSYPNFDILFRVHFDEVEYEIESMFNAMLDTMQFDNDNLYKNIKGYEPNEQGFPVLMIKELYETFLNKSPDYSSISLDDSIYPAKLFDLLGQIGKVSIYGSFCCRKDHDVKIDPYDSEGGRKKTRKRIWGNKRNRAKTRGRK